MEQTQAEQHHEQLQKILEKFKEQFNVELQATGYETTAKENGGIHEEEYWVKGLIEGAEGLNFKVGGWFSMDTRGDDEPMVYCQLSLELNNDELGGREENTRHGKKDGFKNKMLKSRYRPEKEKWGEFNWVTI